MTKVFYVRDFAEPDVLCQVTAEVLITDKVTFRGSIDDPHRQIEQLIEVVALLADRLAVSNQDLLNLLQLHHLEIEREVR